MYSAIYVIQYIDVRSYLILVNYTKVFGSLYRRDFAFLLVSLEYGCMKFNCISPLLVSRRKVIRRKYSIEGCANYTGILNDFN